jgi:hypothetical protein
MNHRLREEGINMVCINMVEVDVMDTVEEHFHSMNHGPEVEGMDTGMGENRAVELEVVEREPEGVVLARHWIGDGAVRHRRTLQEWEELVNRGVQKVNPRLQIRTPVVVRHDVECRRVKKRVKMLWKRCEMSLNHGGIYRVGVKFKKISIFYP